MDLKFPSGRASVNIRDLKAFTETTVSCGMCNKLWLFNTCIKQQLHIFHPCQHLIGSGCWSTVPDEQKDKCPVCKVEIRRDEKVRVYQDSDMDSLVFDKRLTEHISIDSTLAMRVNRKMMEGLNADDVAAIMYYMNLRHPLMSVKNNLHYPIKALTRQHLERLVYFLAHVPLGEHDSQERKIAVALYAFNIGRGTRFSLDDLRVALGSAEDWVKMHFAVILDEEEEEVLPNVMQRCDITGLGSDKQLKEPTNVYWVPVTNPGTKNPYRQTTADVAAITYYMNLRNLWILDLGSFLPSVKVSTRLHLKRLVHFLTHATQNERDRKMTIALHAFNDGRRTKFSLDDFREALLAAEYWIEKHKAFIFGEEEEKGSNVMQGEVVEDEYFSAEEWWAK